MPAAGPRSEARKAGLKRYFTGNPCPRGHVSERLVSTKACVACKPGYDEGRSPRDWAAYYVQHKARLLGGKLRWQKENPAKAAAASARRRAGEDRATPRWLTAEDHDMMQYLYDEAASLSQHTGVKFHVDHIVPLRGKTVSGLHVPWNLRVVAASVNLRKKNKFVEQ